ncbi:MAG: ATP-binding cassette domain-containing protein [Flavobacteriales bacterium]|nr:ATP-binding cassette domain-containing protein [Flavobacteriales bacterium]
MSAPIMVKVEGVGKRYRLGIFNRQQFTDDVKAWTAKLLGRPDPTVPIGGEVDPQRVGEDFWALRDISFEVRQAEVVGIIGHNGAGKSTLLKLLSRITLPTVGTIRMRGKISSLLEVGTGFHPELSGRDNVYLNGAILGMRRAEVDAKMDEIIAFSGITDHIDTPVKRYSSGMRVRLGFAVAAHLEPEILIVDEVLSVGDAAFQRKSMGKMRESAKSGRTVLFVSHNMTAVRSLCSRVVWLDHGRIRMQGNTEDVVNAYLANYTEDRTEIRWDDPTTAPGNELARLRYLRVRPASSSELFQWDDPVVVEAGVENLSAVPEDLNVNFRIMSGDDLVVFTTNFREGCPEGKLDRGMSHVRVELPARLLNANTFKIGVNLSYRAKSIWREDGLVRFEVQEPPRSGAWHGKRMGLLRMPLAWDRTTVSSSIG